MKKIKVLKKFSFKAISVPAKISVIILMTIIFMAVFSDKLSSYNPNIPSGKALESPSAKHILGTDDLGIDLWAQICRGARVSLIIAFSTAFISTFIGTLFGLLAAYYEGLVDSVLMRITDMMIVIPDLPLIIVIAAFFSPSIKNIIFVLVLFSWTIPARVVRSKVLSVKKEGYIVASKSYGAGFLYISRKHLIPQIIPISMVTFIKLISKAVVTEASLAFLGLGDPTSKSWGIILNHAINFKGIYFTDYWKWWVISPLTAILLLVLSIAFLSKEMEVFIYDRK